MLAIPVIDGAVKLFRSKSQNSSRCYVVTDQTFRPAGIVPNLRPRYWPILNGQGVVETCLANQSRVGLAVPPVCNAVNPAGTLDKESGFKRRADWATPFVISSSNV
jgi:hypothetical protein